MSNDLAKTNDPDLSTVEFTYETLKAIIDTELVPKDYRGNVPRALAAILSGRERGLGPMMSLDYIDVIDGRPAPSAEYMVGKILQAGHLVYAEEITDTTCTAVMIRRENGEDRVTHKFTFDMSMAERAGICYKRDGKSLKNNWHDYPEAMLYWRATSQMARMFFADCIGGLSHLKIELDLDAEPAPIPAGVYNEDGVAQFDPRDDRPLEAEVVEDEPEVGEEEGETAQAEVVNEMLEGAYSASAEDIEAAIEEVQAEPLDDTVVDVTGAINEKAREQAVRYLEWEVGLENSGRVKCKNSCERKDPFTSDSFCCQDAHLRRLYGLAPVAFDIPHDDAFADLLHQAVDKHKPGSRHVGDLLKLELEALLTQSKVTFTNYLYGGDGGRPE